MIRASPKMQLLWGAPGLPRPVSIKRGWSVGSTVAPIADKFNVGFDRNELEYSLLH